LVGLLVVTAATVPQTRAQGSGLTGDYYNSTNLTGAKSTRVDATVNFDWRTASPGFGGLGTNNYSVRWSGQVQAPNDDTYTFYVTADDGATLWVNNRLLVSRWFAATPAEMAGQMVLKAGQRVNIYLEYFETTNNATVRLEWAGTNMVRQVIPQAQLYPNTQPAECGLILREHWANLPGTAISNLTNSANYPNYPDGREYLTTFECLQTNWTTNVGTHVTGYVLPTIPGTNTYKFAVAASDTAQLWLSTDTNPANRQLIASVTNATNIRDWSNQVSQISGGIALVGWQKYYIELLHKAGTNNNHYSVAWLPPGATQFSVVGADNLIPPGLSNPLPVATNMFKTLAQSHPRLFATDERFAWLRQQVSNNPTGLAAQWYIANYNAAVNLVNTNLNPPLIYTTNPNYYFARFLIDRMYQLGLAWKISGNTNFAERAWLDLNAAGNFPDWNPQNSWLDVGDATGGFAVGYDWFYDYWSSSRRNFILTNIITKGLQPGLSQYQTKASWTTATHNWNLVINGDLALGALAIGTNYFGTYSNLASVILTNAINSCALAMQHYTADNGAWFEGSGYFDYAGDRNFRMSAGMQSVLGSDFGVSATPGLNNAGLFALLTTSAIERNYNFADVWNAGTTQGPGMTGPYISWWARRFNLAACEAFQRTNGGGDALDALWYDDRGTDPAAEGIGTDCLFNGQTGTTPLNPQNVGVMRSSWNDTNETYLAFKGGKMGEMATGHAHLDAGSFVLEALGQRWGWDLGSDDYSLNGLFDNNPNDPTNHWDYYRIRAEGHNTLLVNPGNGPDFQFGVAPVINFQSKTGVKAMAVVDLTPVETNVVRAWRGLQLFGPQRKQVLIQDEITGGINANVWWFMHYLFSATQVTVSPDGTSAMMTQGTARLWAKILSGGGMFQTMSASPLPASPNPVGQDPNTNFMKLAIHLTGVTNTTIAVWFVPLTPGQNPPVVAPSLVPLAQWQIPETNPPVAVDGYFSTPQNTARNVNLTPFVTDIYTPVSNLVYTVGSPTNGTVALLADGVTAQFTPATNFYGLGQFLYTAADGQGNSATAAMVVTVQPATWYWDTATAAGLQPASGSWDNGTATWSTSSAGSNPLQAWPPLGNDAAFIGAGGNYAISVNGTQNVNQIVTTNGTWTFNGGALNHFNGPMTITANGDTTLNTPLTANTDLNVPGTNRLTLGAVAGFSGDVYLPGGTLRTTVNGILPATASVNVGSTNGTVANLDFTNTSQTIAGLNFQSISTATNFVSIGAGQTLTISNNSSGIAFGVGNFGSTIGSLTATTRVSFVRSGALNIAAPNGIFSIEPGGSNGSKTALSVLDLSGLSGFAANVSDFTALANSGQSAEQFTLTLATNNSIVATNLALAATGNSYGPGTVNLGTTNYIAASNVLLFGGRCGGTMAFQPAVSSNLTIRGVAGGASRANLYVADQANDTGLGSGGGGSTASTGTINCGGARVDARLDQLTLGLGGSAYSGYGAATGTLTFGGSNSIVDVNRLVLGFAALNSAWGLTISNAVTHSGTLNMNGGVLNVNSNFFLGYNADDNLGNPQNVTGVFNLNGGTVNASGNVILGYATNFVGTNTGVLNLSNGTFNAVADIFSTGVNSTGTVSLAGAVLNLNGNDLGSTANPVNLAASSGSLQNVGELNGGTSPLVKTGSGLLALGGANGFSGGTIISAGSLRLAGSLASSLTVSNGTLTGSGTIAGNVQLAAGATFQPSINGYVAGGNYDQLAVSGTVTLAGALTVGVTNAGALPTGFTFTLIRNDGGLPVSGTFAGLPQLATFTNNPLVWRINYQGGTGNDVALTLLSGGAPMTPPTVALTAPTNATSVRAPLTLMATAASPYGIAGVDFYSDSILLGSVAAAPYTLTQNQITPGAHTLIAVAHDIGGLSATSAPVTINILASSFTWDPLHNASGSDGAGSWDASSTNWANNGSEVAWPNHGTDTAVFGTGATLPSGNSVVTLTTPILVGNLTFNTGGNSVSPQYQLTGQYLTLSNTPVINVPASALISSPLTGSGFVKDGAGTLRIEGNATNNFAGNITVSNGVLQLGNNGPAGSLGTGTIMVVDPGVFTVRRQGTLNFSNSIAGTFSSAISFQLNSLNSNAVVTLAKTSTYNAAGGTILSPTASGTVGTLKLGVNNALPTTTAFVITNIGASVQRFDLAGFNQTFSSLATTTGGSVANSIVTNSVSASTSTLTIAGTNSTTYAGLLAGNVGLAKTGSGTLALTGSNTFAGNITIAGGTLQISGTVSNSTFVFVTNAATLQLSGGKITANTVHIYPNAFLLGCGTINGVLLNDGTLLSSCGTNITFNGAVTNNGTMLLTAGTQLDATGPFVNNGLLDIINAAGSLPPGFVNHGVVLDSSSVQVSQIFSSGTDVQVQIFSAAGHTYQLQRSGSLNPANWSDIGASQSGTGSVLTFTDNSVLIQPLGFYRFKVN